jgi:hypothetical protein
VTLAVLLALALSFGAAAFGFDCDEDCRAACGDCALCPMVAEAWETAPGVVRSAVAALDAVPSWRVTSGPRAVAEPVPLAG